MEPHEIAQARNTIEALRPIADRDTAPLEQAVREANVAWTTTQDAAAVGPLNKAARAAQQALDDAIADAAAARRRIAALQSEIDAAELAAPQD